MGDETFIEEILGKLESASDKKEQLEENKKSWEEVARKNKFESISKVFRRVAILQNSLDEVKEDSKKLLKELDQEKEKSS